MTAGACRLLAPASHEDDAGTDGAGARVPAANYRVGGTVAAASGCGALTITPFSLVVAGPIAGALCDRYGTRPVALGSLTLFGLAYLSLALLGGARWPKVRENVTEGSG